MPGTHFPSRPAFRCPPLPTFPFQLGLPSPCRPEPPEVSPGEQTPAAASAAAGPSASGLPWQPGHACAAPTGRPGAHWPTGGRRSRNGRLKPRPRLLGDDNEQLLRQGGLQEPCGKRVLLATPASCSQSFHSTVAGLSY